MAKVIVLTVSGAALVVDAEKLEDYQALVGGYIETIARIVPGTIMLGNEEGRIQNLLINTRATALLRATMGPIVGIVGDVVLVGSKGSEFVSIDESWIQLLQASAAPDGQGAKASTPTPVVERNSA